TGEMIEFVRRISEYAKSQRVGGHFFVVGQNGEALAEHADYLAAIDGIAKEDLYYGYSGIEAVTPANETEYSEAFLLRARDAGKLILTVDYSTDPAQVATIYQRSRARGFVPYATVRDLDRMVVNPGWDPAPSRTIPFSTRRLPGQFFALTAPRGAFRLSLAGDYWREKFVYSASDIIEGAGDDSFEAESFYELTYNLVFGYGLSDSWEIGVRAPIVTSRLERDRNDGLTGLNDRLGETGIGDLHLVLAHSRSADAGARNLLAVLELGLMTDSRAAPFGGGNGDAAFTLTAERYWNRFGIIGTASATHYFGDEGSGGESVLAAAGGIGLQLTNALYASLHAGLEKDTPRVEFTTEHLLGERRSLEFYVGGDLSGDARAAFAGIAINFWIAR
ncbi:MAG: endo alpha-1,4 polygalactosaminidase, partial [Gemmatimonadetes bacterium]|nr:endo alpha-1,4 polygalactosaminidase [Gemmatimonadota bacterium]